jgi:SAM-dependent methyltransferase
MQPSELTHAIIEHWRGRADLQAIRRDLQARGKSPGALEAEDLAPHDQLHAGGLEATRIFMDWVQVPSGARVLDLGAGLGGPARVLASTLACTVTALDISPALTAAGAELTSWMGLSERVAHVAGGLEALEATGGFDLLWLQHLDIHLADKPSFYSACLGHLVPGGRLVLHDWLAGAVGRPRFPLPWSADGSLSFLATRDELAALLHEVGWRISRLEPQEERTLGWYRKLERALTGALGRIPPGDGEERRARLDHLLRETRNVLESLAEGSLLPFFGEARAR